MFGPNCFKKVFQTHHKGYILTPTKKGARVTLCSSIFLREISGALQFGFELVAVDFKSYQAAYFKFWNLLRPQTHKELKLFSSAPDFLQQIKTLSVSNRQSLSFYQTTQYLHPHDSISLFNRDRLNSLNIIPNWVYLRKRKATRGRHHQRVTDSSFHVGLSGHSSILHISRPAGCSSDRYQQ